MNHDWSDYTGIAHDGLDNEKLNLDYWRDFSSAEGPGGEAPSEPYVSQGLEDSLNPSQRLLYDL